MKEIDYIIDENGNKKAMIIPVADYEEIMEDIEDIVIAYQRKEEKKKSFKEIKENLNKKGLV